MPINPVNMKYTIKQLSKENRFVNTYFALFVLCLLAMILAQSCTYNTVPSPNDCSEGPVLSIDDVQNTSCDATQGSARVSAVGGVGAIEFSLDGSTVQTAGVFENLPAGNYTVTVTDVLGCTETENFAISEPNVLAIADAITDVTCNNGNDGAIDITVSGGTPNYTYSWSNTSTTEDPSGLTANTYTVTVTDANGCTVTGSYTVNEPAAIVTNPASTNVTCNGGNDGTASVNPAGGNGGPFNFVWAPMPGGGQVTASVT